MYTCISCVASVHVLDVFMSGSVAGVASLSAPITGSKSVQWMLGVNHSSIEEVWALSLWLY